MTANELWTAYCERNPEFRTAEKITITVKSLEAMVRQAHEKGVQTAAPLRTGDPFYDTVQSIFGAR